MGIFKWLKRKFSKPVKARPFAVITIDGKEFVVLHYESGKDLYERAKISPHRQLYQKCYGPGQDKAIDPTDAELDLWGHEVFYSAPKSITAG